MAHRLAPASCLRQPSAAHPCAACAIPPHYRVFRRVESVASFLGRLPCVPAIVSTLPAFVERGLPRCRCLCRPDAAGQALLYESPGSEGSLSPIEATTSTPSKDVVPWGSGASRPRMACGRSSEPWTAEPSDAPDPPGHDGPRRSRRSCFKPNRHGGPGRSRRSCFKPNRHGGPGRSRRSCAPSPTGTVAPAEADALVLRAQQARRPLPKPTLFASSPPGPTASSDADALL